MLWWADPDLSLLARTTGALVSAFVFVVFAMPWVIQALVKSQIGQIIRKEGPKSHYDKTGTPTMGGVLIIAAMVLSALVWGHWSQPAIWLMLLPTIGFALVGWYDDYLMLIKKQNTGLRVKQKYGLLSIVAIVVVIFLYHAYPHAIQWPFLGMKSNIGPANYVLGYLVMMGSSNAVNLTDGLDGLATGCVMIVLCVLGFLGFVAQDAHLAYRLGLTPIAHIGEVVLVAGALFGACMGFLWHNQFPAAIFMGDVGSLALGALLGVMAIIVQQELAYVLIGGVFVMEAISVILQVGSCKLRGGKRIFKMAPIHHHFELLGWPEPKIVARFWLLGILFAILGLWGVFA